MVERMTGGQAVVRSLAEHGVEVAFGIPGVHTLALYDALIDGPIRHILGRHEQGVGFMADGYARASGKPRSKCRSSLAACSTCRRSESSR